jgi:hypothetical protein
MATLILSTVGTALGGPVGGAIGSLIGQTIDQRLLGPGPRRGPRLGDLGVQTSSYGTPIPRIYGTMRVAGSVVWATELKESEEPSQSGKGQPEMLLYTYSASFAVALSSRVAGEVRRIWADGKLLRGEAGDFKVKTGFRFYTGSEDQQVDPLIASVEGMDRAAAFRGTALAVFEDLQLAEFGNRIPFLTFEVVADPAIMLGGLLGDCSRGAIACASSERIIGYAAHGGSISAALQPLVEQFGLALFDDGDVVRSPDDRVLVAPGEDDLGCSADGRQGLRVERSEVAARDLPAALSIAYHDPARDYQTGQAQAISGVTGGGREAIELPAVLDAGAAKGLAEATLARRWAERERVKISLPPSKMGMMPGSLFRLASSNRLWRARSVTVEAMVTHVEAQPVWDTVGALAAEPGRAVTDPDVVAGPTMMALLDLPDLGTDTAAGPALYLAAASSSGTWRPVPVEVTIGGTVTPSQSAAAETAMGVVTVPPADGRGSELFDMAASIQVQLVHDGQWLESRDDEALANGANLAAVGGELVQFGRAEPLGSGRFRLSKLLRGRRGTEWAMSGHAAGETFVLLSARSLQRIALPEGSIGAVVEVQAHGVGDGAGTWVSAVGNGEALRPPCPVNVMCAMNSGGGIDIAWTRRSRLGWTWQDGMDAPLGESREAYRVRLDGPAGFVERETNIPHTQLRAAEAASVGSGAVAVSVVQIGDRAVSRAATATISIA